MRANVKPPAIVCVEKNPKDARLYTHYLQDTGFDVHTVTPAGCISHLKRNMAADVVLIDAPVMMDTDDNFIQTLKALIDTSHVMILCLWPGGVKTGFPLGESVEIMREPFDTALLHARIERQLIFKQYKDNYEALSRHHKKVKHYVGQLKKALAHREKALGREKELVNNSLRQVALMIEERDRMGRTEGGINDVYRENFDRVIELLVSIVENKRQYHRGHAKRVGDVAVFMARAFGLDETAVRDIHVAARLHEIGKLSVPDEVTQKPPDLRTRSEQDLMTFHPVHGAELLAPFKGFEQIANIIACIHERVDGTGIPKGLKGKAIPLGARIVSLAGFYDNLIVHDQDVPLEKALEIIDGYVGEWFDASVANKLRQYVMENPINGSEKMIEMGIFNLRPDMVLAAPIYTKKGAKLIQSGVTLSTASIDQIARYGKIDPLEETVFIKG